METTKQADMEKKLQTKYAEFQMMEQQMRQLDSNLQALDGQIMELQGMRQSVKELETVKKGSEIMMPITTGMFLKGTVTDSSTVFVNVGNNIIVDKTIPETVELLDKQLEELTKMRQQMLSHLNKLGGKMQTLEVELQKLMMSGSHQH